MANRTSNAEKDARRERALERLRSALPVGSVVTCVLRGVSRTGMSRTVDFYKLAATGGGAHDWLSRSIADAGIGRWDEERGAVRVGGSGLDIGLHVVMVLGRMLYPEGFGCVGEGCPSNDHSNGDRDYTTNSEALIGWAACDDCCELPQGDLAINRGCPRHRHWHKAGDYALRRVWL